MMIGDSLMPTQVFFNWNLLDLAFLMVLINYKPVTIFNSSKKMLTVLFFTEILGLLWPFHFDFT